MGHSLFGFNCLVFRRMPSRSCSRCRCVSYLHTNQNWLKFAARVWGIWKSLELNWSWSWALRYFVQSLKSHFSSHTFILDSRIDSFLYPTKERDDLFTIGTKWLATFPKLEVRRCVTVKDLLALTNHAKRPKFDVNIILIRIIFMYVCHKLYLINGESFTNFQIKRKHFSRDS